MNKQTIINRYFANCEKLHQTWCELPTDIRNFLVTEGVSNHDNEQNEIALNHFKQSRETLERTDYDSCNVKADDFNFASSVKSFVKYKLYSYGSHFPIVVFNVTTNTYYLNYTRYSSSTGSHQSAAFRSVPAGSKVLYCDFENAKFYGGCWTLPTDSALHFSSFDALLAHRKETEKQRKFESKAQAYRVAFSDDFYNVIRYKIFDSAKDGDFSGVKRSLKKWIRTKSFVKYSVFEAMTKQDYFINTLETVKLWDWFIKETNKSIRKYADGLKVA